MHKRQRFSGYLIQKNTVIVIRKKHSDRMPLREGKNFFFGRAEESWYFYGENGVSCLKKI